MNSIIQTYTGIAFDPFNPSAKDVEPIDIAHALAQKCRFNGHTVRFYSVAEHSVHVSREVSRLGGTLDECLWGLLHDAAEAYLPDVPTPIKARLGRAYTDVEDALLRTIVEGLGLAWPEPEIVRHADRALLAAERIQLLSPRRDDLWPNMPVPSPVDLSEAWSVARAESAFLITGALYIAQGTRPT